MGGHGTGAVACGVDPVAHETVAVAFSGGRDSLALLHATCRAAADLGLKVVAIHVHHNLLPEADGWLAGVRELCRRWARRGWPLRLRWVRLDDVPARGDSVEAWARVRRHAALAHLAKAEGATLLLLAQHRRDQAETVLLQALRSGGAAGLSAMPKLVEREGLTWARPWLDVPREAVEAYVRRHRLKPVDDPSNVDAGLARGRLRRALWPTLLAAFPDAETVLAGVARRAQVEAAALAEWSAADLAAVRDGEALQVAAWRGLSPARRELALRAWLARLPGIVPTDALTRRLASELPGATAARWPAGPGRWCVLHRGRLACVALAADGLPPPDPVTLDLRTPGRHPVPGWGGTVEVRPAGRRGVNADALAVVTVTAREGGERFALTPRGLPRSLKKQFQQLGVPAGQRRGPLLWSGGALLFVPGLGIDARRWALADQPCYELQWHSTPDTNGSMLDAGGARP